MLIKHESSMALSSQFRKLDYGCGDGGFREIQQNNRLKRGSWLAMYGDENSYGIDVNPESIAKAKKKITNGTHFMVMDGRDLKFEDNFFDIVHESGALHHMEDYKEGIKQIARVTKKGGLLLLKEVPTDNKFYNFARKKMGNWHGDGVESWFSINELANELLKYFYILDDKCYWRSLISDAIAQYGKEPQISIVYCHVMSKIFQFLEIEYYTCCHWVVRAVRR